MTDDVKPVIPVATVEDEPLTIAIPGGGGFVWAVKIPKFLFDKWMQVDEEGVHLGTLVVDKTLSDVHPDISLKIPKYNDPNDTEIHRLKTEAVINIKQENGLKKEPESSGSQQKWNSNGIPYRYTLNMPAQMRSSNTWLFSEKVRETKGLRLDGTEGRGKRKREKAEPKLLGAINHECTLEPADDPDNKRLYKKLMKDRTEEASVNRRQMKRLEDEVQDQGMRNRMASGWQNITSQLGQSMLDHAGKLPKADKFTAMPQSQLRERLFRLFSEKPYWNAQSLRKEVQQPESHFRPIFKEIAREIETGPYAHLWELRPEWKDVESRKAAMEAEDDAKPDDIKPDVSDDGEIGVDDEDDWREEDFEDVMENM